MMKLFSFCVLCRGRGNVLCDACRADIRRNDNPCRRCATAITAGDICGACLKKPPAFDYTVAPLIYARPLDSLIVKFKYGNGWQLAATLAGFVAAPPPTADLILPVPLHKKREQWRGFNQSRELIRALRQKASNKEHYLQRIKNTPPQSEQPDAAARRRNIKNAFAASSAVRGLSILLVDDVMTSGSTLQEIAQTLKKSGAKQVGNLVIARTVV